MAPISTNLLLTTMGGQIWVKNSENDEENELEENYVESFGCSYGGLELFKGIFIRAAIAYLDALSAQNLSKNLLIDMGILDAHRAAYQDEVVIITNYRLRIEAAVKLLRSWCREQTADSDDLPYTNRSRSQSLDLRELLARRNRTFEMPVYDSILPPGMNQGMMRALDDMNLNYRMDRIPKTLPPVLGELNLRILHHYLAHSYEFNYEDAQEFVLFLDKVKPFLDFGEECWERDPPIEEQIRTVYAGCKPGGKVLLT